MRKKVSITDLILLVLEKTTDGIVRFDDWRHSSFYYLGGWEKPLKKNSFAQAMRRLRIDGYLNLEEYNNKLILKLTEAGKTEALLRKALRDENWDGKWRIVIFDIPEKHRRVRNVLRSRLKSWNFEPWQKSVWASKKNVTEHLRKFISQLGVEKWVRVIESVNV